MDGPTLFSGSGRELGPGIGEGELSGSLPGPSSGLGGGVGVEISTIRVLSGAIERIFFAEYSF